MSKKKALEYNLAVKQKNNPIKIQVASGQNLVIMDYVELDITFEESPNTVFKTEFLVSDTFIDDLILGLKFLGKNNVDILFSSSLIKFQSFNVAFNTPLSNLSQADIDLAEKVKCLSITQRVDKIIQEFMENSNNIGEINNVYHEIKLKNDINMCKKPCTVPLTLLEQFKSKINTLMEGGIIRRSTSNIVSPCFLILKKNND
ncbi:hypothetical protein A0H76_942 [Hepatospora eriocheir]|uniref:Uncharacterized protein n=1 Tax=Hepatospora eriocheir TaxID=1081669 RepID=A0A1X0QI62_9MICR|nr:hypothetical protein A0H76_942 [Hepatospora eriocheir]